MKLANLSMLPAWSSVFFVHCLLYSDMHSHIVSEINITLSNISYHMHNYNTVPLYYVHTTIMFHN